MNIPMHSRVIDLPKCVKDWLYEELMDAFDANGTGAEEAEKTADFILSSNARLCDMEQYIEIKRVGSMMYSIPC